MARVLSVPEFLAASGGESYPAGQIAYTAYEGWAVETLLQPGNVSYYRRKFGEETREFFEAEEPGHIVEEAGDVIWATVAENRTVADCIGLQAGQYSGFHGRPMRAVTGSYPRVGVGSLGSRLQDAAWLFGRKAKLVRWVMTEAPEAVRREYVTDVMNILVPEILGLTVRITELKTGKGIDDIIATNISKLEGRIAAGTLDKAARTRQKQ